MQQVETVVAFYPRRDSGKAARGRRKSGESFLRSVRRLSHRDVRAVRTPIYSWSFRNGYARNELPRRRRELRHIDGVMADCQTNRCDLSMAKMAKKRTRVEKVVQAWSSIECASPRQRFRRGGRLTRAGAR